MACISTYHRYVYRRFEQLNAGTAYHFQTRNLRNVFWLQGSPADPFMYIVNMNDDIVAYNDDYTGLASEIFFTPSVTGTYRLIIRSYNTDRPGICDLYRGTNGTPPLLVESDIYFWGVSSYRQWNQGDVFETTNSGGDPYLYIFSGNKLYRDDDSGAGLNPRWVAPSAGSGIVTLGSYSRWTEGSCDLCIDPPGLRPQTAEATGTTPGEEEFTSQLLESKEDLEPLEPCDRDDRVAELQKKLLSDEARRMYEESQSSEVNKALVTGLM